MNDPRPPAIVVGIDDLRGVYAARALSRHGVPVIGIANDRESYGARTRACQRVIEANTGNDELIEVLAELGPQVDEKAILVPCFEMAVTNISQNRDTLAPWYRIALPAHGAVEILTDKIRFYTHARERGLPIPDTRVLHSRADAERAAKTMSFPCVLKPRNSKSPRWLGQTRLKAFKALESEHLLTLYDRYAPYADGLVAQQWINGDDDSLFTCNGYFGASG